MIKNLLTGLFDPIKIGLSVNKFGQQLPGKVHNMLAPGTKSHGATSAAPLEHRYTGSLRLNASMSDAMSWLDQFAMLEIESDKWQKSTSMVTAATPGKVTAFVQYKASQSFKVRLQPVTGRARVVENLKRSQEGARYDNCVEGITYAYVVRFTFTGSAAEALVEYLTIERIAPDGRSERDLTTYYRAPTMPHQFGAIGDKFLDSVRHASF
jgi:hypothetical protein